MKRREFVKGLAALPVLVSRFSPFGSSSACTPKRRISRVRSSDPLWPSEASWGQLSRSVDGRLVKVESPLDVCTTEPNGEACAEVFRQLKNPYYIGDNPALTQTSGWVDAWTSKPSVFAVAATRTSDVVAAVNFAREHNLRLVVKGGGHSYQGRSCSEDSLLIWTRAMNEITIHDHFVPRGSNDQEAPQHAVTVGAGAIWMQVYDAVTTGAGRYVQGGGCTTVGVAGLIQSGGFGSFSKRFGLASAGLLEAEVVTADGEVRIANEYSNPDLFWAIKGGGGGSFGVVTRLTLRTRELPEYVGSVSGQIRATSDIAFRELVDQIIKHYRDNLFNPHWGEQIRFETGNFLGLNMMFEGLSREQAEAVWQPFLSWVGSRPSDFVFESEVGIVAIPARCLWDVEFLKQNFPDAIGADDRPGAPASNMFWAGDRQQAGQVLHGYRSTWLSAALLEEERRFDLVDALFATSRIWEVSLHVNKGLAGAPAEEILAARNTAMNPTVLDAFALAIIAGESPPAFENVTGYEYDVTTARRRSRTINRATAELLRVVEHGGSYLSESDYFEQDWQRSFWGSNYPQLAAIKRKYDSDGLFFIHHGVGSEEWSDDGFERIVPD